MKRRNLLKAAISISLLSGSIFNRAAFAATGLSDAGVPRSRVRPGYPGWPSKDEWKQLQRETDGSLLKLESPFASCAAYPQSAACKEVLKQIRNPYFVGDQAALTQTSGWLDAWTSRPSVYAVAARGYN